MSCTDCKINSLNSLEARCVTLMSVYVTHINCSSGRDNAVGIATRYRLDGPGIEYRWGTRYSAPVQIGPGAHPASCTMGTGSFLGVNWPGRGVHHPPHLVPRLKEKHSYLSAPPLGFGDLFWGELCF